MPRCLISLGANLGDPLASMHQALFWLRKHFGDAQVHSSRLYRTPAIGGPENQQEFLNAVVALETSLSPWDVWGIIRDIEQRMGRSRNIRWEARSIDVDVLLYEQARIWTPHFKVPHPRMTSRRFVLEPALEVAADWIEPVSGWTIARLHQHITSGVPSLVLSGNQVDVLLGMGKEAVGELGLLPSQCFQRTQPMGSAVSFRSDQVWIEVTENPSLPTVGVASAVESMAVLENPQQAKLLVVAANPPPQDDIAWEDWLRCWADTLGMRDTGATRIHWQGPRYLLPLQNLHWATHELVAALRAMHCPIEPRE